MALALNPASTAIPKGRVAAWHVVPIGRADVWQPLTIRARYDEHRPFVCGPGYYSNNEMHVYIRKIVKRVGILVFPALLRSQGRALPHVQHQQQQQQTRNGDPGFSPQAKHGYTRCSEKLEDTKLEHTKQQITRHLR